MHVALLSHEYPPFIFGGVGTFVENLANGLSMQGLRVTVISGRPMPHPGQQCDNGSNDVSEISVIRYRYPNIPPRHITFQVFNQKKISNIVRHIEADIVHGQGGSTFPALLSLKHQTPTLVTFHSNPKMEKTMSLLSLTRGGNIGDFYTFVMGYPVWAYTYRKELECCDVAVAVSRTLKEELTTRTASYIQQKIFTIHNGVNIEKLEKEHRNASCNDETNHIILFAGRFFWRKGVLNLLRLAHFLQEKHPIDLKIVVHGSGPLYNRMKNEISQHGLRNIILKGFTTRDELMRSMRRAVFVVIPSFYEACPMILLESMCLGKIPITFNLPYATELTKNGRYGIIARNVEDMAAKIKFAYDKLDLKKLGKNISRFAKSEYDIRKTALKYQDLYRKIAG